MCVCVCVCVCVWICACLCFDKVCLSLLFRNGLQTWGVKNKGAFTGLPKYKTGRNLHKMLLGNQMGFLDSSVGKESAWNAADPGLIPVLGRSTGEGIDYPLQYSCGFAGKEYACIEGDLGSIPGLGRSPGEGKGCPLQYSGLENCIIHGAAESDTTEWLSLQSNKNVCIYHVL